MKDVNFQEIERWLLDHYGKEIYHGDLARISAYLPLIGQNVDWNPYIITVGGTNGKGEVCFRLHQRFKNENIKVGTWISPHVESIDERFHFYDGHPSALELFTQFNSVDKLVGPKLSYYEFLFLVFCLLAKAKKLDVLILEIGLGGRLDAVNALNPNLTAITSISRDHQQILGNSYHQILNEKFGISRPNTVLVTSLELNYCQTLAKKWAKKQKTPHLDLFEKGFLKASDAYPRRNWILSEVLFYFYQNKALPQQNIIDLSRSVPAFEGRSETVTSRGRRFIFIGAHNTDGMRKMVDYLRQSEHVVVQALCGFSQRPLPDIRGMLKTLQRLPQLEHCALTDFDHTKAFRISSMEKATILGPNMKIIKDWKLYLENTRPKTKAILVTGSYYFIGEVKKFLRSE